MEEQRLPKGCLSINGGTNTSQYTMKEEVAEDVSNLLEIPSCKGATMDRDGRGRKLREARAGRGL